MPDQFHFAEVSRTKSARYQQKATIFCGLCPAKIPMFVPFFEADPLLFSMKIKKYCPYQPWEATKLENRQ
jgi:hypothetical protein